MAEEEDSDTNPWLVSSIYHFTVFACPECDSWCHHKQDFVEHAFSEHPKSITALSSIHDGSMSDVVLPVKKESSETDSKSTLVTMDVKEEELLEEEESQTKTSNRKCSSILEEFGPPETELQCYYCSETLTVGTIRDHIRELHGGFRKKHFGKHRPFKCSICCQAIESQQLLDSHVCTHKAKLIPKKDNPWDMYKCEECLAEFSKPSQLRKHLTTVHLEMRPFSCNQCDFKAKHNEVLKKHVARIHERIRKHLCSHCGSRFFSPSELRLHIKSLHPEENDDRSQHIGYSCDICGQTLKGLNALKSHKTRRHFLSKQSFLPVTGKLKKCPKCEEIFDTVAIFDGHVLQCCGDAKAFPCNLCSSTWNNAFVLNSHLFDDHNVENYACEVCGKILKGRNSLGIHIKSVHQGIKQKLCKICGKGFTTNKTLRNHEMRVHENSGEFPCSLCDFIAVDKHRFNRHMQGVHLRDQRFECDECNFVCFLKNGLRNHKRVVHLKEKENKCNLCPARYFYKRDLAKHVVKQHQQ